LELEEKMLPAKRGVLSWILAVNYYFLLLNLGESRVAQEEGKFWLFFFNSC